MKVTVAHAACGVTLAGARSLLSVFLPPAPWVHPTHRGAGPCAGFGREVSRWARRGSYSSWGPAPSSLRSAPSGPTCCPCLASLSAPTSPLQPRSREMPSEPPSAPRPAPASMCTQPSLLDARPHVPLQQRDQEAGAPQRGPTSPRARGASAEDMRPEPNRQEGSSVPGAVEAAGGCGQGRGHAGQSSL